MRVLDEMAFAWSAVRARGSRSMLTSLGIAVGIAAVVLLTALGDGVHRFVLNEFTQFGTNIVGVTPGRTTTMGMSGAMVNSVRPLTLDDALELARLPGTAAMTGVVTGNGNVESGRRSRRTSILGVGRGTPSIWGVKVARGRFLPDDDPIAPRAFAVLGGDLAGELFPRSSPLGELVRVGGERYRVVGVLEPKGSFLGLDLDDAVYIPTARALGLFDREGLMELDLQFVHGIDTAAYVERVRSTLIARHGDEDFTITEQAQMLEVLGSVLSVLTLAVAALGGISLLVGGVGIVTIMVIALRERRSEIGLLTALGASPGVVLRLFLLEAAFLAGVGGLAGLAVGGLGAWGLGLAIPALPVSLSLENALLAEAVAVLLGVIAGTLPALRAAGAKPIDALRAE